MFNQIHRDSVFGLVTIFSLLVMTGSFLLAQESGAKKEKSFHDQLIGEYLGFEGDDRVGIELGPGAGGYSVTIYEEGLPGRGHKEKEDDRYVGKATLKDDTLEIELTEKFDGAKKEHLEWKFRKATAAIFKEHGKEGEGVTLTIPKSDKRDKIEVVKIGGGKVSAVNSEKYPDKQFAFEQSLPGIFHGTEGTTPVVVDIDYDKKGVFEIGFFEEKRREPEGFLTKKRDEKDVRYSGIGVLNRGKLEIVLKEKHHEITAEHLEWSVRHLTADITHVDGKLTLTIPATGDWKKVAVTQTEATRKNKTASR